MTLGFVFSATGKYIKSLVNSASVYIDQGKVQATLHDESGEAMIIGPFKIRIDGTHPSYSINSRFFPER